MKNEDESKSYTPDEYIELMKQRSLEKVYKDAEKEEYDNTEKDNNKLMAEYIVKLCDYECELNIKEEMYLSGEYKIINGKKQKVITKKDLVVAKRNVNKMKKKIDSLVEQMILSEQK